MARIRTIKPEFWKNEALCEQPEGVHMFAAALLNYVDDYGYFNANPKLIEAELYPLRKPSVKIPECLQRLQEVGYLRLGEGPDGRKYGQIVHFSNHQKVSHPAKSKIEEISITWNDIQNLPEELQSLQEPLRPEQGTGKGTGNGEQGRRGALTRFDEFWDVCPRKVGKGKAEDRFARVVKAGADPDSIIAAMDRYRISRRGEDEKFTVHPATWLNERRWEDDPGAARRGARHTSFSSPEEQEAQRKAMEAAYGTQAQ